MFRICFPSLSLTSLVPLEVVSATIPCRCAEPVVHFLFEGSHNVARFGKFAAVACFHDPESLFSSEFATVFGSLFDTVEFEPPDSIDMEQFIDHLEDRADEDLVLEYDRTATWCLLTTERIPGQLQVTPERISLTTPQPELPAQLLQSFFDYRTCLDRINCL